MNEIHRSLRRFIIPRDGARAEIPSRELVVRAGFHPKSLSCNFASTEEEHILEQRYNLKFLTLILLHAYLSNLATLVRTVITQEVAENIEPTPELAAGAAAGAAARAEIQVMKSKCADILKQINALHDKSHEITMKERNILDQGDIQFIGSVGGLDIHNTSIPVHTLSDVLQDIERLDDDVVQIVKGHNMNPSMDTIEFAVSSLNFDIFYRCITQSEDFHRFYNGLEEHAQTKQPELKNYITKLHARRDNDKSFYIYFYENIHNIAYNVFYNHEYVLPFDCEREFRFMVRHLKDETKLQVAKLQVVPIPGGVAAVSNFFVSDTPLTAFSGSSQEGTSSGSSTSPDRTVQKLRPGVTTGSRSKGKPLLSLFRSGYDSQGGSRRHARKYTQKRTKTRTRANATHEQKKSAPKQTRRRRGRNDTISIQ